MKQLSIFIFSLLLFLCKSSPTLASKTWVNDSLSLFQIGSDTSSHSQNKTDTLIQYSKTELLQFLDSVGQIPTKELLKNLRNYPDSLFKNRQEFNYKISFTDFEELKKACETNLIDIETAKRIFVGADSNCFAEDPIWIEYISLGEQEFDKYAIGIGSLALARSNLVYFFEEDKLIALHEINHRYGLELNYFTDTHKNTIIYYKENYESGSGIWWFNYYFYMYQQDKLIPVLNEIQNSNLQPLWSIRSFYIESKIITTTPLTIKINYQNTIFDSIFNDVEIVNDSTIINYHWNKINNCFIGDYENSKLTKAQIYSYYLDNNELLYINTHYNLLKKILNGNDETKKGVVLYFVNKVKNILTNQNK